MISSFFNLLQRCISLASPYGKKRLALVSVMIFLNGIMQVIGVTSVFPFFALAAAPEKVYESSPGKWFQKYFPEITTNQLLITAGIFSILILFIANAVAISGEVIRMRYGYGLSHFLRSKMMKSLATREYQYFTAHHSGHLIHKVQGEVAQFINGVFIPMMEAISRLLTLSLLILTIFFVNAYIAVGAALFLGLFYLGAFLLLRKKSRALGQKIRDANRGALINIQQFFGGIKPSIVQNKTSYFINQYLHYSSAQAKLQPLAPLYANSPRYLIEPVALGGLVLIVIVYAARGNSFIEIIPTMSVIALAGYRMLPTLQLLYAQFTQINTMGYTVGVLEEELEKLKKRKNNQHLILFDQKLPEPIDFHKAISLENISFSYDKSAKPLFNDFTLDIPKNSSVGIIGPTGSGKSTLVDMMLGLMIPQKGILKVDDQLIQKENFSNWRAIVGYVPQDIYLIDDSISANIAYGVAADEIDHQRVLEAAKAAQIEHFIETELPEKWETTVGERGVRLSGGQRQRIGLARALYHKPEVLILDEATSALDNETEAELMKAVRKISEDLTLIMIAHRLTTVENCDNIVLIDQGRIEAQGTYEELQKNSSMFRRLALSH